MSSQHYGNSVLRRHVVPICRRYQALQTLQQNNARVNTARVPMDCLHPNAEWPTLSPDISPIKHLLDNIGCQGSQLEAALLRERRRIPQAGIQTFVSFMRQRFVACVAATRVTFDVQHVCPCFTVK